MDRLYLLRITWKKLIRICENLAVLSTGFIHVFGSKKEVFENPKTYEAAKITGCKNIFLPYSGDEEFIEVPLWNIKLKANFQIKSKSGYCGIRANHIEFGSGYFSENVFKARIVGNIETPFRQTIYLKFENAVNDYADYHIQWEVSKDIWDKISKESETINVHLPKDKIMCLES